MLQASLRKPSAQWQLYWADKDHLDGSLYCIQPFLAETVRTPWEGWAWPRPSEGQYLHIQKNSYMRNERWGTGTPSLTRRRCRTSPHRYLSRFIRGCLCCLLGRHFRPNSAPLWMGTTPLAPYKGCLPESRTGEAVWTVPIIAPLFLFIFKRQWKIRGSSYNPRSTNSISKNTNERLCATVI